MENGEQYMELPSAESSAEVIDVGWSGIACLGGMGERFFKPFLTLIRYDKKQNPKKTYGFHPLEAQVQRGSFVTRLGQVLCV